METKIEQGSPQPGSVYMTVDAMYRPTFLANDEPGYGFAEFIACNVKGYCQDEKYLPDYWMFRYDLSDRSLIAAIRALDDRDYPQQIAGIMAEHGIAPADVVRLRDAAFCVEHGIDPLSQAGRHHALIRNPDYIAQASRYGTGLHVICAGQAIFPT